MRMKTDMSDQLHHVGGRVRSARQSDWLPHVRVLLVS
jgi:hypothetical protein